MSSTITLSWPTDEVALLTLDMPNKGANVLSTSVLGELASHLDSLEANEATKGVVIISGKPGIFIAGADLREFAATLDADAKETAGMCRRGQDLFRRLAATPFVTVAAIDGICVGGGAELSLWCDRRIMTSPSKASPRSGASYGFPEVKLGLFPGWGGTVRLPRIVGLSNAVEMVTGGENVSGREAFDMGLAQDLVDASDLLGAAVRMVEAEAQSRDYQKDRQRWSEPIAMSADELGFLGAAASAMILGNTKGQYPAPMAALELMLESSSASIDEAAQMEAEGFAELFGGEVNRSLLNLFFLTDHNKKDPGVDKSDAKPSGVESIGVVGAGIMGAGIAAATLKRGIRTVLTDASTEALAKGGELVVQEAAYDRDLKGPSPEKAMHAGALLSLGSDDEVAHSDVVIEAIIENLDVKREVLQQLEAKMSDDAVLGSNTSTIPITKLAEGLRDPSRFCGIHFFNPVRRMKLVEVIRGEATCDGTVLTAVNYAKRIGKMPIVVHDGPGFLVNRLLFPYMNESLELLAEGVPIANIEKASTRFGMPMGPLALYDMVGLDTAVYAGRVMWEAFPDRIKASPILPALVKQGRLGQKSGSGFFNYENRKRKPQPDPKAMELLSAYLSEPNELDQKAITWRLFAPMVLEATRVLEEGLVRDVRDVDLGMIFGLGFPAFRGGLLHWADTIGARQIVEQLKPLESLGARFEPTALLQEMANKGSTFYGR